MPKAYFGGHSLGSWRRWTDTIRGTAALGRTAVAHIRRVKAIRRVEKGFEALKVWARRQSAQRRLALAHVPDAANVVDMFTKWVPLAKVERSLAWLTGATARAAHAEGRGGNVLAVSTLMFLADALLTMDARNAGWGTEVEPYSEA